MKSKLKWVFVIALVVLVLDHVTKALIVQYVPLGTGFPVIPGFFDIVHGRNTGAAFGFLAGWDSPLKNWFFYLIGLVAAGFLYYYIKSLPAGDRISLVALSLIAGGALGNLTDRLWRGSVVDFLSVHYHHGLWEPQIAGYQFTIPLTWPAFNVADAAISTAVFLLIVQNIRSSKASTNQEA